ncbi:c-type cytochrome [Psychrobacter sp. AOP7-B1-24]|uniref:c-type cytochrome n=1 Tax=Psychrobacter sp. AOP7-B1-24 TaxID=3457645 RepID=UPI00402BA104
MKYKLKQINKNICSAISIIALLALNACSDDSTATKEPAANESANTSVVAEDTPISDSEVARSEPVVKVEAVETTAVTEVSESEVTAEPEVLAADAGAKLYESNCKVCHEAGLLNAPKYGDKAAWAARLSKGKDTLHIHSAKGFKNMPAQVTDKISEAQVYAAVDYMIEAVS